MPGWNATLWGGAGSGVDAGVSGRALITRVYQMLGVLRSGQAPSADQIAEGLLELNQMLDAWSIEGQAVPAVRREVFDLTAGTVTYEFGEEAKPRAASLLPAGAVQERPLDLLGDDPRRTGLTGVYLDGDGTLVLWPAPAEGERLAVYTAVPLESFRDADTLYTLPAGYALAMRFCLAAQMAPAAMIHVKIAAPLLDTIEMKAREFKARVKARNSRPVLLRCDDGLLSRRWPL